MTTNVKCIETGEVFSSISAASRCYGGNVGRAIRLKFDCHGKHFCFTAESVNTTDIKTHIHKPKKTKTDPVHICPLCRVPICNCGWWHGLHEPEGAETATVFKRDYVRGSKKRQTIEQKIVTSCPNFTKKKPENKTKADIGTDENYQRLANAVIVAAVEDYKTALERWDEIEILNLYDFFTSRYFGTLTEANPRFILKKVEQEVNDERKGTSKWRVPYRTKNRR